MWRGETPGQLPTPPERLPVTVPVADRGDRRLRRNVAYVGIDVAFAKNKLLPVCICIRQNERLLPLPLRRRDRRPPRGRGNAAALDRALVDQFARDVRTYIEAVAQDERVSIERIAIDAPSDYRADGHPRRAADAAMDRAGISCFTTPSRRDFTEIARKVRAHLAEGEPETNMPHANQLWMLVGFALFRELASVADCIEVFPQAIVRRIGAGDTHKSKAEGIEAQLAAASAYTGWPATVHGEPSFDDVCLAPAHDRLDAYLSAWVASLDEHQRSAYGDPPGDVIWVPRVAGLGRGQSRT